MSDYDTRLVRVQRLSRLERFEMRELYLAHYDATDAERFESDLDAKTEALLVRHQGRLVGFTASEVYERRWRGRLIRVIYSGDTIVERAHWGQQALSFAWIGRLGELHREKPGTPLYWFVIVKGHRTFKFLPAFARSFHPHWALDRSDLKPLADDLAREKFGACYDAGAGLVRFPRSQGQLRADLAAPSEAELKKESVRFFLARNPGHASGHELVCLCEIAEENMRPLTRRLFERVPAC